MFRILSALVKQWPVTCVSYLPEGLGAQRDKYAILISINLLVVYRESVNLIGYLIRRLPADSLQLSIANENRLF